VQEGLKEYQTFKLADDLGKAYGDNTSAPPKGRRAGVLMHPTSLPGDYGVGSIGAEAHAFVDWLATAGMQVRRRPRHSPASPLPWPEGPDRHKKLCSPAGLGHAANPGWTVRRRPAEVAAHVRLAGPCSCRRQQCRHCDRHCAAAAVQV
jgi:hypothetical protein